MGQANNRGTFEERQAAATDRRLEQIRLRRIAADRTLHTAALRGLRPPNTRSLAQPAILLGLSLTVPPRL